MVLLGSWLTGCELLLAGQLAKTPKETFWDFACNYFSPPRHQQRGPAILTVSSLPHVCVHGPPFHIFSSLISFIIVSEFSLHRSYTYFIRLTDDKNSLFEDWEESSVGKVMKWAWGPESDLPRSTLESQALSAFRHGKTRADKPSSLMDNLLTVDSFWGGENQLCLRMWPVVGPPCFSWWPHTHEDLGSKNWTWVIKRKKKNPKLGRGEEVRDGFGGIAGESDQNK